MIRRPVVPGFHGITWTKRTKRSIFDHFCMPTLYSPLGGFINECITKSTSSPKQGSSLLMVWMAATVNMCACSVSFPAGCKTNTQPMHILQGQGLLGVTWTNWNEEPNSCWLCCMIIWFLMHWHTCVPRVRTVSGCVLKALGRKKHNSFGLLSRNHHIDLL